MTGILWAVLQSPIAIARRFPNGMPHHVTLQFGVERDDWSFLVGQAFSAFLESECWNEKIQALTIELPGGIPCQNAAPHLTVSWADGVSPVESNAMLSSLHQSAPVYTTAQFKIEFYEWKS